MDKNKKFIRKKENEKQVYHHVFIIPKKQNKEMKNMTEYKKQQFKAKKERFLHLFELLSVKTMPYNKIYRATIAYKLKTDEEDIETLVRPRPMRGAIMAYVRHNLVINYDEALKCLNAHPERDELYKKLQDKVNELVSKKYSLIRTSRKMTRRLIDEIKNSNK